MNLRLIRSCIDITGLDASVCSNLLTRHTVKFDDGHTPLKISPVALPSISLVSSSREATSLPPFHLSFATTSH
jgi:hypothetical protein